MEACLKQRQCKAGGDDARHEAVFRIGKRIARANRAPGKTRHDQTGKSGEDGRAAPPIAVEREVRRDPALFQRAEDLAEDGQVEGRGLLAGDQIRVDRGGVAVLTDIKMSSFYRVNAMFAG